jgi:arylsulfatase A-like enzyme
VCVLGIVLSVVPAPWAQSVASPAIVQPGPRLPVDARPNVLLIVADDLGVDIPAVYAEHPEAANTPNIDALAAGGVLFRNAWSNPVCSPTRATILTGRRSLDTGVGVPIPYPTDTFELMLDEPTIPKEIGGPYRTAVVGKWHLSTLAGSGPLHPLLLGFEHHRGPMDNLPGYANYPKAVDGVVSQSFTYATTEQVDDALQLIEGFGDQRWFLWLAFSASHSPLHVPPAGLTTFQLPTMISENPALFFRAVTEALDTELGRLLATMDPAVLAKTVVVFVGDNGTPPHVTTPPFDPDHAKWTVYEGGVNVPLIVRGPGVAAGAECAALVHTMDLFATVLELAEVAPPPSDSVSIVPYLADPDRPSIRPWVYAETFTPNGFFGSLNRSRAVRDVEAYKLIYHYVGSATPTQVELFDLVADPFEQANLLEQGSLTPQQSKALGRLTVAMDSVGTP